MSDIQQRLAETSGDIWQQFLEGCTVHAGPPEDYASPIEFAFAFAVVAQIHINPLANGDLWFWAMHRLTLQEAADTCLAHANKYKFGGVFPQAQIGSHRVDFLVLHVKPGGGYAGIIVECDGHDFHERTKEQAASDKSRDRELQSHGFHVLRFTGSEIWRDAYACADQTLWMAINGALHARGEAA